ncbi:MAG: acyl-CoA dehydrogenase family protein, partial [Myxococcota bacterium]|nr:acyl-CoA dehydrogenase family protein [Myxococcota bacterium]
MAERHLLPEQLEFQESARAWLEDNPAPPTQVRLPLSSLEVKTQDQIDYLRDWQRRCYEAGLVGTDIPTEYGGHGHTGCQAIANREMSRARAPFLVNTVGLSMMIPTVLEHGTEEQKKRFIPNALSAEEIWCQGFSEPGAGSDMANQQTFAARQGEDWVVNGHKVWTSFGHFSKWMILLARTSRDHKYDGLTFFLAPIEGHPGVTVKPLVKMTGETGFNEVFFDDAVLTDDLRLDEVGKGWTVAMTTLTFERGAAEGAGGGASPDLNLDRLIALAKDSVRNGRSAAQDPLTRDAIVQHAIIQA